MVLSLTRSLPKALGGSSTNSPREKISSLTRSLPKALGGSSTYSPRETLSSLTQSLPKALGGSSTYSPRETLSLLTRSRLTKHSRAPPTEQRHHHASLSLNIYKDLGANSPTESYVEPKGGHACNLM